MNTDRARLLALTPLALLLAGCVHDFAGMGPPDAAPFGEANRQTMMAQVVDPEPEYDTLVPATSAEHAAQAAERYHQGKVIRPDRVTSTQTGSGGGGK